ncbi:hypothetical protein PMAYCL1PPCAC_18368 [Pristionchus mayeri]|uniref:Uncharacterized protein n=1 Tax=Pristionchus mayeri TaxID=1317129 RepID=A0AAN5CPG7_9BILA|nr:hypothetical protein PMAYCL1PPCAC_18368 [Pristionchus mayeri]
MWCSFIFFLSLLFLGSAVDFEDNYNIAVKRGGMGGYAFGSMAHQWPAHLRKFMRVQQKRGDINYR